MRLYGLRPLKIFIYFSAGIDFRRQNLMSKVAPRTVTVYIQTYMPTCMAISAELWRLQKHTVC